MGCNPQERKPSLGISDGFLLKDVPSEAAIVFTFTRVLLSDLLKTRNLSWRLVEAHVLSPLGCSRFTGKEVCHADD
jgi:hypothetical protein